MSYVNTVNLPSNDILNLVQVGTLRFDDTPRACLRSHQLESKLRTAYTCKKMKRPTAKFGISAGLDALVQLLLSSKYLAYVLSQARLIYYAYEPRPPEGEDRVEKIERRARPSSSRKAVLRAHRTA